MKRHDISEHAQAPVSVAGGVTVPENWRDAGASDQSAAALHMRIASTDETRRNGEFLFERICDFVKRARRKNDEKSVRDLRRLVSAAPTLALGVPDFLEYISDRFRKGHRQAVGHILGAVRRGRPIEQHQYLVALVDLIKQEGKWSDAMACKKLHDLPGSPFAHISIEAMRTIYSNRRETAHALRGYHVSEQDLAQVPRDLLADILGACER